MKIERIEEVVNSASSMSDAKKAVLSKKRSKIQKALWKDPDIRRRRLSGWLRVAKDPELQKLKGEKISKAQVGVVRPHMIETGNKRRGKTHEAIFGKDVAEKMRKTNSDSHKGKTAWNKGLTKDDPRVARYIKTRKDNDNYSHTVATKKRLSAIGLEKWQDPKYAESQIHAQASGRGSVCPSGYEEKIMHLCDVYGFPFAFVGNWQFVVGTYCPDFVDTQDMGLLVETYCAYWHEADYETTRSRYFRKRGFETLFLSDEDLLSDDWEEICAGKLRKFVLAM